MRNLKMKNRARGFTIIEVLVAIGIMSVLTLAMIHMSDTSFKAARAVRQSTSAVSVRQGVSTVLNSISMCAPAFKDAAGGPGNLNLGVNWVGPTPLTRIDFGSEVLAEVGQVHGELQTESITLAKQEGPFDVQVNTTPGAPAATMQLMKRYTAMLTLVQKKWARESTHGGEQLQPSAFYMVLTVDNTGRLFNCYGGAQWDMLRDICEQQLDGSWDASKRPACLIRRMTIANTFAERDAAYNATVPLVPNFAGPGLPPALVTDGYLFARGGVQFGDIGPWRGSPSTERAWMGKCPATTGFPCVVGGDLAAGVLHISGIENASYPRVEENNPGPNPDARRVVSILDHLTLPVPYSRLWVGTNTVPNGSVNNAGILHVINHYGPGASAPPAEETTTTAVFQANRSMGVVMTTGAEPPGNQGTISMYALSTSPTGSQPYWYTATAKDTTSAFNGGMFLGFQPLAGANVNHFMINRSGGVSFPAGRVRIGGSTSTDPAAGLSVT